MTIEQATVLTCDVALLVLGIRALGRMIARPRAPPPDEREVIEVLDGPHRCRTARRRR